MESLEHRVVGNLDARFHTADHARIAVTAVDAAQRSGALALRGVDDAAVTLFERAQGFLYREPCSAEELAEALKR